MATSQESRECPEQATNSSQTELPRKRAINIRGVPDAVWCRARMNALESRLPLKDYVIQLLSQSEPL